MFLFSFFCCYCSFQWLFKVCKTQSDCALKKSLIVLCTRNQIHKHALFFQDEWPVGGVAVCTSTVWSYMLDPYIDFRVIRFSSIFQSCYGIAAYRCSNSLKCSPSFRNHQRSGMTASAALPTFKPFLGGLETEDG